jgi:acyl-coenzyme A synthetase/AMP-(fatty) acid ligase
LIIVERLPRNATGKLPQQELQQLASRHLQTNETP